MEITAIIYLQTIKELQIINSPRHFSISYTHEKYEIFTQIPWYTDWVI